MACVGLKLCSKRPRRLAFESILSVQLLTMPSVSVHDVVSKLKDDALLISGYKQLAGGLGVPDSEYRGVENAFKNDTTSVYELLKRILELWLMKKNNCSVDVTTMPGKTVGELCSILSAEEFTNPSEILQTSFGSESIIQVEISKSKQIVSLLNRKWWPEKKDLPFSFVDRTTSSGTLLVDELDRMLHQEAKKAVISQQACISGLGGIGKTTLAKWYANRFSSRFDLIIWLDCGETSLSPSIENLWGELFGESERDKTTTVTSKARACFALLQEFKTLLVYDNAEEYAGTAGIKHVLPSAQQCPKIHCLVTSRWTLWGSKSMYGEIPQWRLATLSMEESIALLRKSLDNVTTPTNAELQELCNTLGCLPLALQIAIVHLNEHYSARPNGARLFNQALLKSYESLLEPPADLDDYQKGLLATLSQTALKVKGQGVIGEKAWRWMCSMAFLNPSVPLRFLLCVEQTEMEMGLSICRVLSKYSLVSVSGEYEECEVSIHRLLQGTLQILCRSESLEHHSRVLRCDIDDPSFALYKWKSYLECWENPDLPTGHLETAKRHINDGLTMEDVEWGRNVKQGLLLLGIYDEMKGWNIHTQENSNFEQPNPQWHLRDSSLTKSDLESFSSYYYNDCFVCYMRAAVNYRLGDRNQALQHWETCKEKAAKLRDLMGATGGDATSKLSELRCPMENIYILTPSEWFYLYDDPNAADTLLVSIIATCRLLRAQVLIDLQNLEEADNAIKEIANLQDNRMHIPIDCFPCTLALDKLVRNHFDCLCLERVNVSYESAVEWVEQCFGHVYVDCKFVDLRFVNNGEVYPENVDYHHVLPSKARSLTVRSQDESDATGITFHISKLWAGTETLMLEGCTVVWDTSESLLPNCGMISVSILEPRNGFPIHNSFSNYFGPKLREISISHAKLPLSLLPASLDKLKLADVQVIPQEQIDRPPNIKKLTLKHYSDLECILGIVKLLHFAKLKLKFCGCPPDYQCHTADECTFMKILKISQQTDVKCTQTILQRHLAKHGFCINESNPTAASDYAFNGTTLVLKGLQNVDIPTSIQSSDSFSPQ